MKKKQLFAGALAAAMMTASLAGCGGAASSAATSTTGGDTASSTASADTNSGVVEVTIPSYKTGENAGAAFFVPQVERFNEKYAGKYKINLESVPQDSIFNDRLKQLAQQNKLPVLVEGGDPDWVKNVVIPNGLAYDLTDWIDATPAVKDVLIDDSREYCSNEDGRVMTMPLATVRPIGFFYNSDMWSTDADISAMSMDEFVSALGDQKIAFSTAENGWVSALFLTALVAEEDGGVEWLKSGTETKITDFNQPRVVSRFGCTKDEESRVRSAKMLAVCLYLMQGTPYIYQGEELGMTNKHFDSIDPINDVMTRNAYFEKTQRCGESVADFMKAANYISREHTRTPMHWDDTANAGFTTGTPWIPLNPNYPQINAAKQVGDPDSVYSFYRRLLALRKSDKTFVYGHYALLLPDDEEIYAYTRTLNDEQILVVCNFTDHDVPCPLLNDWQNTEQLISNYNTPGNPGSLRPFEAVVYRK